MQLAFFSQVLPCYTRDDLERLQPISPSLHAMIVYHSNRLALRPIHSVRMGDSISIFVEEDAADAHEPDYKASTHDGDFAETFRRLQNICVNEFYVAVHDSPFLRHWKAQETASFTVVGIRCDGVGAVDYDVLDSVVNHLRPRITEFFIYWPADNHDNRGLKFLARESFLSSLETCCVYVRGNTFPVAEFVLKQPGYANYLLSWYFDAADAIDGFIESFDRVGCANRKLESVCMRWYDRHGSQSAPKRLSNPTKIERPLPENALTDVFDEDDLCFRVSECEMHTIVNKTQRLRMEAFKWTVEEEEDEREDEEDRSDHTERVTSHILQCLVKDF